MPENSTRARSFTVPVGAEENVRLPPTKLGNETIGLDADQPMRRRSYSRSRPGSRENSCRYPRKNCSRWKNRTRRSPPAPRRWFASTTNSIRRAHSRHGRRDRIRSSHRPPAQRAAAPWSATQPTNRRHERHRLAISALPQYSAVPASQPRAPQALCFHSARDNSVTNSSVEAPPFTSRRSSAPENRPQVSRFTRSYSL